MRRLQWHQQTRNKFFQNKSLARFKVTDGILLREVNAALFAHPGVKVPNFSILSLEPAFFNAKFTFRTLCKHKSLRLMAKTAAKTIGKLGGVAQRRSGIDVYVEVNAVEKERVENFIKQISETTGIEMGDVERSIGYGVLHGNFVIEPYGENISRVDGVESFENAKSEKSYDFYN
jgi:hypothetical protein